MQCPPASGSSCNGTPRPERVQRLPNNEPAHTNNHRAFPASCPPVLSAFAKPIPEQPARSTPLLTSVLFRTDHGVRGAKLASPLSMPVRVKTPARQKSTFVGEPGLRAAREPWHVS